VPAIILPPSLTDKLTALNILLQVMGVAGVSSLSATEDNDVAAALAALDEFDRAVQSQGWTWNRDEAVQLSPDTNGEIALPNNCLSIKRAYTVPGGDKIIERGRKLYNKTTNTFVFADPVFVDVVYRLDWEEMTEAMRRYITIWAAQQLQARLQTSTAVDRITDEVVAAAKAECGQAEDEVEEHNSVTGNSQMLSRLHGRARRRMN
jgi:hypothetical protein